MPKYVFSSFCVLIAISTSFSQELAIPLCPEIVPNQIIFYEVEKQYYEDNIFWISNVQEPTLEMYLPSKQNAIGKAVVIYPRGAYHHLAIDWEGADITKWLNSKGIAAFFIKYRLPESKSLIINYQAPLQDAQRAIRLVRHHTEKWHISKNQINIIGFSAGGHLASTLGTNYEDVNKIITDSIDAQSVRPDFMVLIYPVITMKSPYTHLSLRTNLLGANPKLELIDFYFNELHVTKNTPPAFIVHSSDDNSVHVMNSLLFYQVLKKEDVYSELHIYPKGGHGFALANGKGRLQNWTYLLTYLLTF